MNNNIITEVIAEFEQFLNWESQSYENWEKVDVFIAETLSEAWVLARPYDAYKFQDKEFKRAVDNANGKWLEKTNPTDSYKIILSTEYGDSIQALTKTFVYEMRQCLDYQNAVKDLPFEDYRPGNEYYNNWSVFRAVYASTRYEFYARCVEDKNVFDILAEILGRNSADAVTGLIRSKDNRRETLYYISRYIGASRAIRNTNMDETINVEVFHLWTMTPQYIIENYGNVFYIGNEWDETEVCELEAIPKTHYYSDLLTRINDQQE